MDALAGLLDGPRARGAFLLRMVMEPPWAVRVADRAPICLMSVTRGAAWIVPPEGAEPVRLVPGDIAVVRGPHPYTVADAPGTDPGALVGPGGLCTTIHGQPLAQEMVLGVRTWGNAAHGATAVLVGTYLMDGEISRRLLDALPPLLGSPPTPGPGRCCGCSTRRSPRTSRGSTSSWTGCSTCCSSPCCAAGSPGPAPRPPPGTGP